MFLETTAQARQQLFHIEGLALVCFAGRGATFSENIVKTHIWRAVGAYYGLFANMKWDAWNCDLAPHMRTTILTNHHIGLYVMELFRFA